MNDLINILKTKTGVSKDYKYKKITIQKETVYIIFNEVLVDPQTVNNIILRRLTLLTKKTLNNL